MRITGNGGYPWISWSNVTPANMLLRGTKDSRDGHRCAPANSYAYTSKGLAANSSVVILPSYSAVSTFTT